MSKNSIILKITLLFIFSSISFVLFVIYFINAEISGTNNLIEQRYNRVILDIGNLFRFGYTIDSLHDHLISLGFYQVSDSKVVDEISKQYMLIYGQNGQIAINSQMLDGHHYLVIYDNTSNKTAIYTDYKDTTNYSTYYLIASLAFITLVFFYVIVLNSLLPLYSLRKEVKKFAKGDTNIKVVSRRQDEIGELSNEFVKAADRINEMNKARILFLRSIMHELKTPITKGRIVIEMIHDAKAKHRLVSVFKRLNAIIDDFAKIEEMSTKNYKISKTQFRLIDLIQNINKMLLIEEDRPRNVILYDREAEMIADIDAMSLSVKNLVDNAVKYTTDQKVFVYVDGTDLVVQNQGEPFKDNFENYFQPFYNDGKDNPKKGLGLGMYIIKHTIEAQGFELRHKYINGNHYFFIKNCVIKNPIKNLTKIPANNPIKNPTKEEQ